jgi:hypothetical protein
MHGGASPRYMRHPNFKHGRYSKYGFGEAREWVKAARRRKEVRIMRAVCQKFNEWVERHGEPNGGAFFVVFERIRREHLASLERRREARRARVRKARAGVSDTLKN